MTDVKIYANTKTLYAAIDKMAVNANALGLTIQGAAVSCILMAADSGNSNPAAYLFNKLSTVDPKRSMVNRPALGKWLKIHGIKINYDKEAKVFKAKLDTEAIAKVRVDIAVDRDEATTKLLNFPFTNLDDTASQFSGFDVAARIKSLLAQADKVKADPTKANHVKNNFQGITALQKWADQFVPAKVA